MAKKASKKQQTNEGDGGKQRRFQTYPSIDLEEALSRVKLLYDKDKTAGAPTEAAIKHMGFNSKSGPAMATIASLRKFGLVNSENMRIVPTQRAIEILILPDDDVRKVQAMKKAAVSPPLFAELFNRFQKTGIPSPESLRSDLILESKVNPNVARQVVDDFKSTLIYAGLTDKDGILLSVDVEADTDDHSDPLVGTDLFDQIPKKPDQPKPDSGKMINLPVTLPTLKIATVTVPDQMTELEFKTLVDTIAGWKSALVKSPEKVQAETAEEPQPDKNEDSE